MCHPWEEAPVWSESEDAEANDDVTSDVQQEVAPS